MLNFKVVKYIKWWSNNNNMLFNGLYDYLSWKFNFKGWRVAGRSGRIKTPPEREREKKNKKRKVRSQA